MATSASPHQMHAKQMPWANVKASPLTNTPHSNAIVGLTYCMKPKMVRGDGVCRRREQDERNGRDRTAQDEKPVVLHPAALVTSPRNP